MTDPIYDCDGCGVRLPEDPEQRALLHLATPLGRCAVHVHKVRECAERARERKGGGRFIKWVTREERERGELRSP